MTFSAVHRPAAICTGAVIGVSFGSRAEVARCDETVSLTQKADQPLLQSIIPQCQNATSHNLRWESRGQIAMYVGSRSGRPFYAAVVRCRVAAQWAVPPAHRNGRRLLRLRAGGPYALNCLRYDVSGTHLSRRRPNGPPNFVRPSSVFVNRSADFYLYTGEPCKSGYQLGSGNCRKTNGRIVAVPREDCLAQAGTVELPVEDGIPPGPAPRR
jgi:hypothetical protein